MSRKTAKVFIVSGRVQGVGYRAFAQHAARETGVTGWVRNLANGDVEAHATGGAAELDGFEARLRSGPRFAEVRSIRSTEAATLAMSEFQIR